MSQVSRTIANGRREFFRTAALLAAPAAMVASTLSPTSARAAGDPGEFTAAKQFFRSIEDHENDHVGFLRATLGDDARPRLTFKNLEQDTYADFVALARVLENTGVRAYLGAIPFFLDQGTLAAASAIATVEARHAGVLNVFVGYNITLGDQSFDMEQDDGKIREAIRPFIADLNGGSPVAYNQTRSDANDVNILNFALALEYLEARFYTLNVPKFFGQRPGIPG